MRKIFLTFLILLSMNLVFGSTSRGKIMKEPIFSLKVQFSACTYKVLINDVPVLASDEGFPINARLPVK